MPICVIEKFHLLKFHNLIPLLHLTMINIKSHNFFLTINYI